MMLPLENFTIVSEVLFDYIKKYEKVLDPESIKEILFYIEHGEYEIAYEGFLLELMEAKIKHSICDQERILDIAKTIGLDEASILDPDIYDKVIQYFFEIS